MSSDSIIPAFLKKLSELIKFIKQNENTRQDIINKMINLQTWLVNNRSLQEHKCCQAFLTYLWQSYGKNYKSRKGFVTWIKCNLRFADIKITKAIIEGQKVIFQKFLLHSLSFGSCSQKTHHKFFNDLKEYALQKWKIDFELWYKEWSDNENTLQ